MLLCSSQEPSLRYHGSPVKYRKLSEFFAIVFWQQVCPTGSWQMFATMLLSKLSLFYFDDCIVLSDVYDTRENEQIITNEMSEFKGK